MSLFLPIVVVILTAFMNPGFIAVDDYSSNIEMVVPASKVTVASIVEGSDFRPPYANIFFVAITKCADALGLTHPLSQLCLLRLVIAAMALILFFLSVSILSQTNNWHGEFAFVTLFFLSPLLFSRPLIEGLSAPWLLISGVLATIYFRTGKSVSIAGAVVTLFFASLFRYQCGTVLPALLALPLVRRKWSDLIHAIWVALTLFVILGWIDLNLKGSFHASLRSYLAYNAVHSASYGTTPWYSYLAILSLFVVPLLPFTRGMKWKATYQDQIPLILYLGTFIFAHSVVGHKEERFLVPILPIFLVLLYPIWKRGSEKLRQVYFVANGVLCLLASLATPQSNVIKLAEYLDNHKSIEHMISIDDTLAVFPRVFVDRKLKEVRVERFPSTAIECGMVVVSHRDYVSENKVEGWIKSAEFPPGPLEALVIRLNPTKNNRRRTIQVFRPRICVKPSN